MPDKPSKNEVTPDQVDLFLRLFRSRKDIFAERWTSKKTGKTGYQPSCYNEWKPDLCKKPCRTCPNAKYRPLDEVVIRKHLAGIEILGVYYLLEDNTCWCIAGDFDNHDGNREPLMDVQAFAAACEMQGIACHVFASKSGKGYHVYLFLAEPIEAWKARAVYHALLIEAGVLDEDHELDNSFDRLFPNQDRLSGKGFGNLIVYPLLDILHDSGKSLILDPETNFEKPFADPWAALADADINGRTTRAQIEGLVTTWNLHQDKRLKTTGSSPDIDPAEVDHDVRRALDGKPIPAGVRDETLFKLGCRLRGKGVSYAEARAAMQMYHAQCEQPSGDKYTIEEVFAKLDSAWKYSPNEDESKTEEPEIVWINRDTLKCRPPEPTYLCNINGIGFIPKGTVGAIVAAGATGKSYFLSHMGVSLTSGKGFGPIDPLSKCRVMILNAEDDGDMIGRRVWDITRGEIPDGLNLAAVCSVVKPVMEMKSGNPIRGAGFDWIDGLLLEKPADVLIIDPFSRFYGIDECNSSHGTAWISALENLRSRHGITIVVAHHANEASQEKVGRMTMTMLRGNSAFVAGYRFVIGMRKLTDADAKLFGVEDDRKSYVEIDDLKRNEGRALQRHFYLHQNDQTGTYESFNPDRARVGDMAEALVNAIEETGEKLSRRDLTKQPSGRAISEMVGEAVPGFVRTNDMARVIDYCLEKGWLIETEIEVGKTKKTVVMRDNGGKSDRRKTAEKNPFPPLTAYNYSEITAEIDFDGNKKISIENTNDSNMITAEKITPPKGGERPFSAVPPLGVFRTADDCAGCSAFDLRRGYCLEHVDHPNSKMKSDAPCDQARTVCRGPYQ